MNNYKMVIAYDGTKYKGWQRLGNADNTIQGKIEGVLTRMLGKETEISGASRTDAGVHARGQVANFNSEKVLECDSFMRELNGYLPEDICIMSLEQASDRFHSRYNAKGKVYVYQICNGVKISPFEKNYFTSTETLNIEAMRRAAQKFIGSHDFTAFTTAKAKKKSMVRTVNRIELKVDGPKVYIEIEGDGFLHNQIRRMVGVLMDIGLGERKPESVTDIIGSMDKSKCGVTAPAAGLFLEKVLYH